MESSLEQRYAINLCMQLEKNSTETFEMLQEAFKEERISKSQSVRWHKAFKEVASEPGSGHPTTARTNENVHRVREVLRSDRRLSIQQFSETLPVQIGSTWDSNLEKRNENLDLEKRKLCEKLVPKVLTED
ncbi:protein GVQW3-like [Hetaerina americana]|uniref:protein GVQW3-like n=1 Tax=Hetaerina americana TaxID=62018 RepID=UPI003A7F5493